MSTAYVNPNAQIISYTYIANSKPRVYWLKSPFSSEKGLLFSARDLHNLFSGNFTIKFVKETLPNEKDGYLIGNSLADNGIPLLITGEFSSKTWDDDFINKYVNQDLMPQSQCHFVGDEQGGYSRLVYVANIPESVGFSAGFTAHRTRGTWSSYPTHDFETESLLSPASLYPDFDEIFAYVTDPPGGWGIQCITSHKGAFTDTITDRQIRHIPISSHPVVAGPGVRLGYFWIFVGGSRKF